jgi:Protein of unknown function (DUF2975)
MNLTEIILIVAVIWFAFMFRWLKKYEARGGAEMRDKRLTRIRNASMVVQVLVIIGFAMTVYGVLAFFMGWRFFSESHIRVFVGEHHIYTSPADMPGEVYGLWLVKMLWSTVCYTALFLLFNLYQRGVLFSARNVSLIRALGYYLLVDWIIDYQMQGALRDMQLSTNSLFIGLLIIFVSWIMDEGRKIQEEQELTV